MPEKNEKVDGDVTIGAEGDDVPVSGGRTEEVETNEFGVPPFLEYLRRAVERIDSLYSQDSPENSVVGLPSGFANLDRITNGFEPGDLVVVAGRPSMGKSIFAMNIAEHISLVLHLPAAIFTMEMSGEQYTNRMMASTGRVSLNALYTGNLEDRDWSRLTYGIGKLSDAPVLIDETHALTFKVLREHAREAARQFGGRLGVIVIDYIQLMSGEWDLPSTNRNNEISEITRGLKALAKELNVPVIVISQLSRAVEQRTNKRPLLADLRDSGALEEDADVIVFLYRDEYYNPDSHDRGLAEAIVAKQRNGRKGTARLSFNGDFAKFEDCTGELELPEMKSQPKPRSTRSK